MLGELFLDPAEELKLYLSREDLLDVSSVKMSMNKDAFNFYGYNEINIEGARTKIKFIKKEFVDKFINYLKSEHLHFSGPKSYVNKVITSKGVELSNLVLFHISKNSSSIDFISGSKDKVSRMRLMGWPEHDAVAFLNGGVEYSNNYLIKLAAIKKNSFLPSWFAYLQFIPEKFSVVEKSGTSKIEICNTAYNMSKTFRDYVRSTNLDLAERVEFEFQNKSLPTSKSLSDENIMYSITKNVKAKLDKTYSKLN